MQHICKYCSKTFEKSTQLGSHVIRCQYNPRYSDIRDIITNKMSAHAKEKHPKIDFTLVCPVCNSNYVITVTQHKYDIGKYRHTCSAKCAHKLSTMNTDKENRNNKISNSLIGRKIENKHPITNRPLKKYICVHCGKNYTLKEYESQKYCSKECAKEHKHILLSEAAKRRGIGGFVENSINACYQGIYKGIKCDSSWELAFILWNEMQGKSVQRYKGYLTYTFEDKLCKYYPDFIVDDKIYEIKGYYSSRAKAKHEQHPEVILLKREEMIPIINEVKEKYGNNFIELYEL